MYKEKKKRKIQMFFLYSQENKICTKEKGTKNTYVLYPQENKICTKKREQKNLNISSSFRL